MYVPKSMLWMTQLIRGPLAFDGQSWPKGTEWYWCCCRKNQCQSVNPHTGPLSTQEQMFEYLSRGLQNNVTCENV